MESNVMSLHEGMVSRYHEPVGKKLENIKISDRQRALHTTQQAWQHVTSHLDRKIIAQRETEKEAAHRKAMKEGSENMTKQWINSVQNVRKRKEEQRIRRLAEREEKREKTYQELTAVTTEQREKFLDEMGRKRQKGDPDVRRVNQAVTLSRTMYERDRQKEVALMKAEHEAIVEAEWAERVRQGAIDEKHEWEEKDRKELEKRLKHKELILKQIQDKEEMEKKEKEEKIKEEKADNERAAFEMAGIKEERRIEEQKQKDDRKKELLMFMKKKEKLKEKMEAEDNERDKIVKIIDEAKQKIRCLTDKRKKQLLEEEFQRRMAAGEKLRTLKTNKEAEDEAKFLQVIAEKEKADDEALEVKKNKEKELTEERKQDYRNAMQNMAKEVMKQDEMKKWEMLNRCKREEVIKQQDFEVEQIRKVKIKKRGQEVVKQIEQNQERDRKEKETEFKLKNNYEETDQKFFEYAEQMKEYCKKRGFSTIPIDREIEAYKRRNDLIAKSNKIRSSRAEIQKTLVNIKPGKMCHHPNTDPTYCRCKCAKERIYN